MPGRTILLFLIVLTAVSCKENALFLSGDNAIGTIQLAPFEKVEVKDVFDIVLVSDTVDYVKIECGENLLPNVEIKQENNLINLYNHNKYHWSRKYKKVNLEIHSTILKIITIREPISLITKNTFKGESITIIDWSKISIVEMIVDVNHVYIDVSSNNTGEYTVKGKTNTCFLRAWGSCFYYADELNTDDCYVKHDGIGDVYVNVKNKLTVKLLTYGNVYYKGSPNEIVEEKHSTGSLIKLD